MGTGVEEGMWPKRPCWQWVWAI